MRRVRACAASTDARALRDDHNSQQGGSIKSWKQRWFILYGKHIAYFEKDDSGSLGKLIPKGCIHIHDVKCEPTKHPKHGLPHGKITPYRAACSRLQCDHRGGCSMTIDNTIYVKNN